MKEKKYRIVEVDWYGHKFDDSIGSKVKKISFGYLVDEDDEKIVLAQTMSEYSVGNFIEIPKRDIISLVRIDIDSEKSTTYIFDKSKNKWNLIPHWFFNKISDTEETPEVKPEVKPEVNKTIKEEMLIWCRKHGYYKCLKCNFLFYDIETLYLHDCNFYKVHVSADESKPISSERVVKKKEVF